MVAESGEAGRVVWALLGGRKKVGKLVGWRHGG